MNCSNSVLHYLYIMADDLVIYAKARAFKARIYPPPAVQKHHTTVSYNSLVEKRGRRGRPRWTNSLSVCD